jgi:hypothetical protein
MCMQCVTSATTAVTAVTAATGLRAWLVARQPQWLTPRRTKRLSAALIAGGVLAAGAVGA